MPVPPEGYHAARFSPDGRWIVTDIISPEGAQRDVALFDLERRTLRRLTFDRSSVAPVWTPDGRRIVFATSSGGRLPGFEIRWVTADGSDSAGTLLGADRSQVPVAFAPDGRSLVVQREDPETRHDLWILPLEGEHAPKPYLRTPFDERAAALSPDGRWLAYVSDESGRDEVYVRAFPVPGPALRVSEDGGREPRWAHSGWELFYRTNGGMVASALAAASPLTIGRREVLFDDRPYVTIPNGAGYDVHPDGNRFLMIRRGSESREVVVVLNWFDQLRAGER
jgi:serine/threonine-protein kinase